MITLTRFTCYLKAKDKLRPHKTSNNITCLISQVSYDNLTSTIKAPFVYYAAMWKPGQVRQFEEVAQWSGEESLTFDDIFPNVKHGLNAKHLIVGTNLVSISDGASTCPNDRLIS